MTSWYEPPRRRRPGTLDGLVEYVLLVVLCLAALTLVTALHGGVG